MSNWASEWHWHRAASRPRRDDQIQVAVAQYCGVERRDRVVTESRRVSDCIGVMNRARLDLEVGGCDCVHPGPVTRFIFLQLNIEW